MRWNVLIGLPALAVLLGIGSLQAAPPARAQEPLAIPSLSQPIGVTAAAPPDIGPPVLLDPLTAPGLLSAIECPTKRNSRRFVGEGYLLAVTGQCMESSETASIGEMLDGLTLPDGELRFETRAVSGAARAQISFYFRDQGGEGDAYQVTLEPANGRAELRTYFNGRSFTLVERDDLAGLFSSSEWTTVALRLCGADFWLLLDGELVLQRTEPALDSGSVSLILARLGPLEDTDESAAVFRNLRVAALMNGDPTRAPTFQNSHQAPPPGASAEPFAE